MKRLIFIPLLIFSISLSAQFTKGGGTFLKSGNAFISTVAEADTLGPECIREGTFATSTYWTEGANWAWSAGYETYDNLENSGWLTQIDGDMLTSMKPGTNYRLTFTIDIVSGTGGIYILSGDGNHMYVDWGNYGDGNHAVYFTATSDGWWSKGIGFMASAFSDNAFTITNISLKERL